VTRPGPHVRYSGARRAGADSRQQELCDSFTSHMGFFSVYVWFYANYMQFEMKV